VTDHLQQAKEAQERILVIQAEGIALNAPEARQAVNRLMAQLRKLSAAERAEFDAWKEARRG
jgi:hypothetical protein